MGMTPVTDEEFATAVLAADKPSLVDFWADWCGPCRQVSPILDEIAAANPEKMNFFKMDVDANPVTQSNYRVTGLPTIAVFSGGEMVKVIIGAKPKSAILNELADFLA